MYVGFTLMAPTEAGKPWPQPVSITSRLRRRVMIVRIMVCFKKNARGCVHHGYYTVHLLPI